MRALAPVQSSPAVQTVEAIRAQAVRPNGSSPGRALPLVAHWNTGIVKGSFSPDYQMQMIAQGHHLLPWFQMPAIGAPTDDPMWFSYYEASVKQAAQLKLPLSFISTQW